MKRAIVLGMVLLVPGATARAQEPASDPFQFGEIHLGVMQTDSSTLSSKFTEYREVPDGVVVPAFRLKGETGAGFRYEAFGGNVQQTDQYYGLRLGRGALSLDGLYNRIPHNFGNAGHTLLERTGEGVWVLSDTLQRSFQNALTTQFDCTGLTTAQCSAKRAQINFVFLNNLVTPSLAAANTVDLRLERERGHLSFRVAPVGPVDVRLTYFRERRVGGRAASGPANGFGSVVELPEPLHYLTQDFGADAEYEARWGLLRAGLHFNRFENRVETLAFDNPFRITDSTDPNAYQAPGSGSVGGPVFGLMALPPDNEAVTGSLGATFKLPSRTRISANASLARWTQDQSPFIPYTTNTTVVGEDGAGGTFPATDPGRLPARQLDGRIDVTSLSLNLSSRPTPQLSFNARFRDYDLGNDTPQIRFPGYVRFDGVWEEIPRISVPYAYRNRRLDATAAYDFGPVSLEGGFRHTSMARHFRETEDTSENAVSVAADLRAAGWAVLRASFERARRDFEGLEIELSEEASFQVHGTPANLLAVDPATVCPAGRVCNLRFDQAKKDADRVGAHLQLTPWGNATFALGYQHTKDDYTETTFGLVEAQYDTFTAEVDYAPSARTNLFGYFTHEKIADFQRGRQSGATVSTNPLDDWTSNVDDKAASFGGGANFVLRPDAWFLELSGRYQKVNGNNDLFAAPGGAPFAARTALGGVQDIPFYDDTKITTLQAEVRYQFARSWSATLGGWFEDYEIRDSNTQELLNYVPGSFFLAAQDGDYEAKVGYFRLSYRW